jgi:hypothetical protein
MNQFVVDADLTLDPADFTTMVDLRMPRAMARLFGHLGAAFFVLDEQTGEFFPSPTAKELCLIIERAHNVPAAQVDAKAEVLVAAAKAAYDVHVQLVTNFMTEDDTFFKGLP